MKHITKQAACVAVSSAFAGLSLAAVSPDEAKQLGGAALTAFGAERAGNKDGSIPPYTGEAINPPASYSPQEPGRLPNPFNDKPLFSITAQNMGQYADKLAEAHKALLKNYAGFRMDVYPSRRTAMYPKYVLDNTLKNATACKGGGGEELWLEGCYGGVMFPIPKTGRQVMWNKLTRYVGHAWKINLKTVLITPDGSPVVQGVNKIHQEFSIYDPKKTGTELPTDALYYTMRYDLVGPARRFGEKGLFLYPLDPIKGARVYQYIPGQRRVKLAPDLSYDTPNPQSGGGATQDETNIFFGALDRYDFKLDGKREMFILYSNYDAHDYKKCPDDVLFRRGFMNPDCVRWELHRVWQVTATLKPGFRHAYHKRVMYFDEDTWSAGVGDNYDASGKLYRIDFASQQTYYPTGGEGILHNINHPTYVVDLQKGSWYTTFHSAYPEGGIVSELPRPGTYYSPEALGGQGVR